MENRVVKLAPSILAADFAHLGERVAEAERERANRVHVTAELIKQPLRW